MRDLLDILAAHGALPAGEPATLATVVRVEGSAYRMPGARMLVDAAGRRVGSVSGGCLEADVARRGRLLPAGSPGVLVRYDGVDDAETAWNYALGCDGAIEVFIERLAAGAPIISSSRAASALTPSPGTPGERRGEGDFEHRTTLEFRNHPLPHPLPHPDPFPAYRERGPERVGSAGARSLEFLRRCVRDRFAGVLITVFAAPAGVAIAVGDRFTLSPDSPADDFADIADQDLRSALLADAHCVLDSGQTATVTYRTAAGPVHALVEFIQPPMALIICGAGHDAVPLVAAAKALGWHVTVADRRAGYARVYRFPGADLVVTAGFGESSSSAAPLAIPDHAAVVIMTHHYPDDRAVLGQALRSNASYIGVLGPRVRTQRMLAELAVEGMDARPQQLARLHAPIGLDLGAEGAGPVALSIVAEILAVTHGRPGRSLRERQGPIHTPAASRVVTAIGSTEQSTPSPPPPPPPPPLRVDCEPSLPK
jgi:xanthine dehydrogenase accessory factor